MKRPKERIFNIILINLNKKLTDSINNDKLKKYLFKLQHKKKSILAIVF